jgi:uncharacterized RDD family membrane protein YckC
MNTDQSRPNLYAPPQSEVSDTTEEGAELVRAGRGERLGAHILDGIIPGVVMIPMLIGLGFDFSALSSGNIGTFTIVGIVIAVIGLLAWIGITIYFVNRNGQTIAKRIIGIKVVRSDGSRATLARIFWMRNVVNALPGMIPFLGYIYQLVDYLLIFGEKQQCIHDMIADTIVVKA